MQKLKAFLQYLFFRTYTVKSTDDLIEVFSRDWEKGDVIYIPHGTYINGRRV
jgi:hypothetical protein